MKKIIAVAVTFAAVAGLSSVATARKPDPAPVIYHRTTVVAEGQFEASASCDDVGDSVISGGFTAARSRITYSAPRTWTDGPDSPPDRWEIRWPQGKPGPVHVLAVCMRGVDSEMPE